MKRPNDGYYPGTIRPYRQCPADFVERYLELGQGKEIEEYYRTNYRCIRRWIDESGGEDLRARRRAITGCPARPYLRARNYVLGNSLRRAKG